ncbi:MAG: hypothetical protein ACYTGC_12270, partial [Planctomycetota bacterium]
EGRTPKTGDAAVYDWQLIDVGDAPIGGLEPGATYFLVVQSRVDDDDMSTLIAGLAESRAQARLADTIDLTSTGVGPQLFRSGESLAGQVTIGTAGTALALGGVDGRFVTFLDADGSFSPGDVLVDQSGASLTFRSTTTRIDSIAVLEDERSLTPIPIDGVLDADAVFTLFVDGDEFPDITVSPNPANRDRLPLLAGEPLAGQIMVDGKLPEDAFLTITYTQVDLLFDSGDAAVVDLDADTFRIAAHGLQSDDVVVYETNGSSDEIGRLEVGAEYTVLFVDDDSFQLTAGDPAQVVELTDLGTGLHRLRFTETVDVLVPGLDGTALGFLGDETGLGFVFASEALPEHGGVLPQIATFRLQVGSDEPRFVVVTDMMTADNAGEAVRLLGFDETDAASPLLTAAREPLDLVLGVDVDFRLQVGGGELVPVSLRAAATSDNLELADLVDDLNDAIARAGLGVVTAGTDGDRLTLAAPAPLLFRGDLTLAEKLDRLVEDLNVSLSIVDFAQTVEALREGTATVLGGASLTQVLTVAASGGAFVLEYGGERTAPIAFGADDAAVTAALAALDAIDPGDVTVTLVPSAAGVGVYEIQFGGDIDANTVLPLSVDTTGTGRVENDASLLQTVTIGASAGTYTLAYAGDPTDPIAHDADAEAVQAALEDLPGLDPGDLLVEREVDMFTGVATITVQFGGTVTGATVQTLMADGSELTGIALTSGTAEVVQVATVVASAGTFTLSYAGETTRELPFDASAELVAQALGELDALAPEDVSATRLFDEVISELTFTISFEVSEDAIEVLTADGAGLVGATNVTGGPSLTQVVRIDALQGLFRLVYGDDPTGPLSLDSSAATIDGALEALAAIGPGDVTVDRTLENGTVVLTLTFGGSIAAEAVAQVEVDTEGLTTLAGDRLILRTNTLEMLAVTSGGNAADNSDVMDLVADINTALAVAGVDTLIEAALQDGRIVLRGRDGSRLTALKVETDVDPVTGTDVLGFVDGQADSRISGLVADIQAAVDGAVGDDVLEVVVVGDVTEPFSRLGFAPAAGQTLASLRLTAGVDDPTVTQLGFTDVTDGSTRLNPLEDAKQRVDLLARSRSDSSFLLESGLTASLTLANGIDLLGFEVGQMGADSIEAVERPVSFVLDHDLAFFLTVGDAAPARVVVSALRTQGVGDDKNPDANATAGDLAADVRRAINAALGGNVVKVSVNKGRLVLTSVDAEPLTIATAAATSRFGFIGLDLVGPVQVTAETVVDSVDPDP